jgi:hypothetical protein
VCERRIGLALVARHVGRLAAIGDAITVEVDDARIVGRGPPRRAALSVRRSAEPSATQAEMLFHQGKCLMAAGKLPEACAAFDASQLLDPTAPGKPARQMNATASARAADLETRLSTLRISVTPELWSAKRKLAASLGAGDPFGASLELSASGARLVVGAPAEASRATGLGGDQADGTAAGAGAAYLFLRDGMSWIQEVCLKASNTGAGDVRAQRRALGRRCHARDRRRRRGQQGAASAATRPTTPPAAPGRVHVPVTRADR